MVNEKEALRSRLLARRAAMSPAEREAAALALSERAPELLPGARTVAAYVSLGSEPGTGPLLDRLQAAGVRVLLPVLLPDNDLDWAEYAGPDALARARLGLLEPTGPRLGVAAVTAADAVLLPGLAVGPEGLRLGRGGGSYDRVLARLSHAHAHPRLITLLYDDELLPHVPSEPHDAKVDTVLTPTRTLHFP